MMSLRRGGLAVLLIATSLTFFASGPASAGPRPDIRPSLRILNYNTGFLWIDLPGACGGIDINDGLFNGLDYEDRAAEIAEAIIATDNDVVVLNEVFSNPVKDTLVSLLAPHYPNYISKLSKQLELEISNVLLSTILGPVSWPCQEWLSASQTTTLTSADSGLMVFVKEGFSFAPFSSGTNPPYDVATVIGKNNGLYWGDQGEVAVDSYDFSLDLGLLEPGECYGDDCLSSKAAVMVRVAHSSGDVYNIAFSHTQAWNNPEQVATREKQFKVMKNVILDSLTPKELASQPVYVTGDLNVPGENKADSKPGSEWTTLFNSAQSSSGNFFACGLGPCTFDPNNGSPSGSLLTDAWGFQTSTDDEGVTNADDDARLDYFLDNQNVSGPAARFCVQHVMRAYDLEEGASPLSDHLGVRADVARKAPHCSANDDAGAYGPEPIVLDTSGDFKASGIISFPGNMQWFKLDAGQGWGTGSYVFSLESADPDMELDLDVYESTDLSKPIPMFREDAILRGVKYSLTKPPYYIRVFATDPDSGQPDRTLTGPYTFKVHENRGLSPEDAIALLPAEPHPYPWPAFPLFDPDPSASQDNVTFKPDTEVWHEFYTDTSTAGTFPEVDFLSENDENIDGGSDNPPFSLKLRADAAGYPGLAEEMDQSPGSGGPQPTPPHDYDLDGSVDHRLDAPDLPGTGNGPERYFLTMQRHGEAMYADIHSVTTFRTTLTYLKSLRVIPRSGQGFANYFQWAYDSSGTPWCMNAPGAHCHGPKQLDDDVQWGPTDASFHGSFTESVTPNLWADYGQGTAKLEPRYSDTIDAQSRDSSDVDTKLDFVWAEGAYNADDADYWFELWYCVGHQTERVSHCMWTD